ncbi:MAG: class I SAM-dependent methyltransferase, partial [Planctomycetota bacterium]|nr:class I SAM-dependent methyltransferase [Planctomycetota bacterium]
MSLRSIRSDPYFGVETLVDLNHPVRKAYHNRFDLVVDGGTTEHCFRPDEVLSNAARMAKPGGIIIRAHLIFVMPFSSKVRPNLHSCAPIPRRADFLLPTCSRTVR